VPSQLHETFSFTRPNKQLQLLFNDCMVCYGFHTIIEETCLLLVPCPCSLRSMAMRSW
jgi:hypothetical protein